MTEAISAFVATATTPGAAPQGKGLGSMLVMFALIFVLFYFLMIMPAKKKQKKHQEMLSSLKSGDRIVTNGGIYGTVVGVSESMIQIRIAEKVKIDVAKNAIAGLQGEPTA